MIVLQSTKSASSFQQTNSLHDVVETFVTQHKNLNRRVSKGARKKVRVVVVVVASSVFVWPAGIHCLIDLSTPSFSTPTTPSSSSTCPVCTARRATRVCAGAAGGVRPLGGRGEPGRAANDLNHQRPAQ